MSCYMLMQIDEQRYKNIIATMNDILEDSASPYYGLIDNVLTNMTFQLWPLVVGTHHQRVRVHLIKCMKQFYRELDTFQHDIFTPMGLYVVPPGDEAAWTLGAFSGEVKDGYLYGRGAVDMKGGIACSVAAVLQYLNDHGGKPKGSISFLITGDEEDVSINGTVKLLKWCAERGEKFDHCVLGEPSNVEVLGDMIKIGRRGSQSGTLVVDGVQGHVAYPHRASNPVPDISRLIVALGDEPLDHGSAQFQASNLEFTTVEIGRASCRERV